MYHTRKPTPHVLPVMDCGRSKMATTQEPLGKSSTPHTADALKRAVTEKSRTASTVTVPLTALREALLSAGPDSEASVLSAALSEARAESVKLWAERHAAATEGAFDPEEVSALKKFAASRAAEEARWAIKGGPDSAVFSPTHDPAWLRGYAPLSPAMLGAGRRELVVADGNCVTFPLRTYEAEISETPVVLPSVAAAPTT